MRVFVIGAILGLLVSGCASISHHSDKPTNTALAVLADENEAAIRGLLERQALAWNRGDIDAFMEDYWKSDDLRFASGGTVIRGWQGTLDRYKRRYSDRAAMGELAFENLEVSVLSDDAAIVHGAWSLKREADRPSGLFTLVFRDFGDGWMITSDTTTSAD